jgi:hypothetical protein
MVTEWELWASANHMVQQHGPDAPIHAAMRLDALIEQGDHEGAATWRMILNRIDQLLAEPAGSSIN